MDYIKDHTYLTDCTITWCEPTKEEHLELVLRELREYSRRKWYENKKRVLQDAIFHLKEYDKLNK